MDENGKKSVFTVKKVLRALSLVCIILVFCPSFLVSCSGETMKVNVMTAIGGVEAYGEKVVDPHPVMLLCLLIPAAVLVLLFIKKFTDKKTAAIILGGTAVDLVIWFAFRSSVKNLAEENNFEFKTTGWYVLNIIVLILIIVLTALVVASKMQMDADLVSALTGGGAQNMLHQMSSAVTQAAGNAASSIGNRTKKEDTIGFCSKCGSPIAYGCKFCTSCGTPVPESMIAEAEEAKRAAEEAARKEAEEKARLAAEAEAKKKEAEQNGFSEKERPAFCRQCGAKLGPDAMFCESCGAKIE